jgi:hypothetical protein
MTVEGKQLFDKHVLEWLVAHGQPVDTDPLRWAVETGKVEILKDVRSGTVPISVASFSQLHDYVDANEYGKAFDWPTLPSETDDDAYQQACCDFWNKVQDTLHDWIASGEMRQDLSRGRRR